MTIFLPRLNCFSGQVRVKKCSRAFNIRNGMFYVVMFQINSDLCGIFNFAMCEDKNLPLSVIEIEDLREVKKSVGRLQLLWKFLYGEFLSMWR